MPEHRAEDAQPHLSKQEEAFGKLGTSTPTTQESRSPKALERERNSQEG